MNILKFANCTVLDENGEETLISTLWQKQTVLFVFLRHFGCVACRAQAHQIWSEREKYESSGARIIFIGNGTANYLKFFKENLNIKDAPVFTDPTLKSFLHAGFKRGFFALVNPKTAFNGIKLLANGYTQAPFDRESGSHWQLGGILVVHPDSSTGYHYISHALGDFPPEKDLLDIKDQPLTPAVVKNLRPTSF